MPLPWIVVVIIEGIAFELIKHGAVWVFSTPPPAGKRPPLIYDEKSGYTFRKQADGSYRIDDGPRRF